MEPRHSCRRGARLNDGDHGPVAWCEAPVGAVRGLSQVLSWGVSAGVWVAGRVATWSGAFPGVRRGEYARPRRWWADGSVAI